MFRKWRNRRSCRRSRLIPVRSAAVPQAQQAFKQSQSGDVGPSTSLLVLAVASLLLSKVVDGKGTLLLSSQTSARSASQDANSPDVAVVQLVIS